MDSLVPVLDKLVNVGIFAVVAYLIVALSIIGGVITVFMIIFKQIREEEKQAMQMQNKWNERLRR